MNMVAWGFLIVKTVDGKDGFRIWDFGFRGGIGAEAPISIYGECAQASLKSPHKSKLTCPSGQEGSERSGQGAFYHCKAQKRLFNDTQIAVFSFCVSFRLFRK